MVFTPIMQVIINQQHITIMSIICHLYPHNMFNGWKPFMIDVYIPTKRNHQPISMLKMLWTKNLSWKRCHCWYFKTLEIWKKWEYSSTVRRCPSALRGPSPSSGRTPWSALVLSASKKVKPWLLSCATSLRGTKKTADLTHSRLKNCRIFAICCGKHMCLNVFYIPLMTSAHIVWSQWYVFLPPTSATVHWGCV